MPTSLIAIITFTSDTPGDLSFSHGDCLTGLTLKGGWWKGTDAQGQEGSFPANYVKEKSTTSSSRTASSTSKSMPSSQPTTGRPTTKKKRGSIFNEQMQADIKSFKSLKKKDGKSQIAKYGITWKQDSETNACPLCNQAFTLIRRRHHCRKCGGVFCHKCSKARMLVAGSNNKKRVCDDCVALLSSGTEEGSKGGTGTGTGTCASKQPAGLVPAVPEPDAENVISAVTSAGGVTSAVAGDVTCAVAGDATSAVAATVAATVHVGAAPAAAVMTTATAATAAPKSTFKDAAKKFASGGAKAGRRGSAMFGKLLVSARKKIADSGVKMPINIPGMPGMSIPPAGVGSAVASVSGVAANASQEAATQFSSASGDVVNERNGERKAMGLNVHIESFNALSKLKESLESFQKELGVDLSNKSDVTIDTTTFSNEEAFLALPEKGDRSGMDQTSRTSRLGGVVKFLLAGIVKQSSKDEAFKTLIAERLRAVQVGYDCTNSISYTARNTQTVVSWRAEVVPRDSGGFTLVITQNLNESRNGLNNVKEVLEPALGLGVDEVEMRRCAAEAQQERRDVERQKRAEASGGAKAGRRGSAMFGKLLVSARKKIANSGVKMPINIPGMPGMSVPAGVGSTVASASGDVVIIGSFNALPSTLDFLQEIFDKNITLELDTSVLNSPKFIWFHEWRQEMTWNRKGSQKEMTWNRRCDPSSVCDSTPWKAAILQFLTAYETEDAQNMFMLPLLLEAFKLIGVEYTKILTKKLSSIMIFVDVSNGGDKPSKSHVNESGKSIYRGDTWFEPTIEFLEEGRLLRVGVNMDQLEAVCYNVVVNQKPPNGPSSAELASKLNEKFNICLASTGSLTGDILRSLCGPQLSEAQAVLDEFLERSCPIHIDTESFRSAPEFVSLSLEKQASTLKAMLEVFPKRAIENKDIGLMALAGLDIGKDKLNTLGVKSIRLRVDIQSQQPTIQTEMPPMICQEQSSRYGGCRAILLEPEEFQECEGGLRMWRFPGTTTRHGRERCVKVNLDKGPAHQDPNIKTNAPRWHCEGCHWNTCVLCADQWLKETHPWWMTDKAPIGASVSLTEDNSIEFVINLVGLKKAIEKIDDWSLRLFSALDLVMHAARAECKEETEFVTKNLNQALYPDGEEGEGEMSVEVDWDGFTGSPQFLALEGVVQVSVIKLCSTRMQSATLLGGIEKYSNNTQKGAEAVSMGFSRYGAGLCVYPEMRSAIKEKIRKILFQIHPEDDAEDNTISVDDAEKTLIVHFNLGTLVKAVTSVSKQQLADIAKNMRKEYKQKNSNSKEGLMCKLTAQQKWGQRVRIRQVTREEAEFIQGNRCGFTDKMVPLLGMEGFVDKCDGRLLGGAICQDCHVLGQWWRPEMLEMTGDHGPDGTSVELPKEVPRFERIGIRVLDGLNLWPSRYAGAHNAAIHFFNKTCEGLDDEPLPADVPVEFDWTHLEREAPNDKSQDYADKTKQVAKWAATALCGYYFNFSKSGYHDCSLTHLCGVCPDLAAAVKGKTFVITPVYFTGTILMPTTRGTDPRTYQHNLDISLEGKTRIIVKYIFTSNLDFGIGRNVQLMLTPKTAKTCEARRIARLHEYDKFETWRRSMVHRYDSERDQIIQPLQKSLQMFESFHRDKSDYGRDQVPEIKSMKSQIESHRAHYSNLKQQEYESMVGKVNKNLKENFPTPEGGAWAEGYVLSHFNESQHFFDAHHSISAAEIAPAADAARAPAAAKAEADSWSITKEELADHSLRALEARAKEFGTPLSMEDTTAAMMFLADADVDLPTSKQEHDEKMKDMQRMDQESLTQMIGMFKMMTGIVDVKPSSSEEEIRGVICSDTDITAKKTAPFSITAEEFANGMFESMQKRANELSLSYPDDDWALLKGYVMTSAGDGLPESQEECDEIFGEMTGADKDDMESMLAMMLHQIKQANNPTNVEVMVTSEGILYKETPKEESSEEADETKNAEDTTVPAAAENSVDPLGGRFLPRRSLLGKSAKIPSELAEAAIACGLLAQIVSKDSVEKGMDCVWLRGSNSKNDGGVYLATKAEGSIGDDSDGIGMGFPENTNRWASMISETEKGANGDYNFASRGKAFCYTQEPSQMELDAIAIEKAARHAALAGIRAKAREDVTHAYGPDGIFLFDLAIFTQDEWGMPWWEDDWGVKRTSKDMIGKEYNSDLRKHGITFSKRVETSSKESSVPLSFDPEDASGWRVTSVNLYTMQDNYKSELNNSDDFQARIPPSLMSMSFLEQLTIDGNRWPFKDGGLSELPEDMFSFFPNLKELTLGQLALKKCPSSMALLVNIVTLDMSETKFVEPCDVSMVSKWQKLRTLKVHASATENFMKALKTLPALEEVDVWNNRVLKSIPVEMFENKPMLKKFGFHNMTRIKYPQALPDLPNIKSADWGVPSKEDGSQDLSNLTTLTHLSYFGCTLHYCPKGLGLLTSLTEVRLFNVNDIRPSGDGDTVLGAGWIGGMKSLKSFEVRNSNMTLISEEIGRCTDLEDLSIEGNKLLLALPSGLQQCHKLNSLDVSGCAVLEGTWPETPNTTWPKMRSLKAKRTPLGVTSLVTWVAFVRISRGDYKPRQFEADFTQEQEDEIKKCVEMYNIEAAPDSEECTLWKEVESFSGRKPFDNWPYRKVDGNKYQYHGNRMSKHEDFVTTTKAVAVSYPNIVDFNITANSWDCIEPKSSKEEPFDMSSLAALNPETLEVLYLYRNCTGYLNCSVISQFVNLRELNLYRGTMISFAPLQALVKLESLCLAMTKLDNNDIKFLAQLPCTATMTDLDISSNSDFDNAAPLSSFSNLVKLKLNGCSSITSLAFLSGMKDTLEELECNRTAAKFENFPMLGLQMKSLYLCSMEDMTHLGPIAHLTNLECLILSANCNLSDISPLNNMRELREVDLSGIGLESGDAMAAAVREVLISCPLIKIMDVKGPKGYDKMMSIKQIQTLLDDFPEKIQRHDLEKAQMRENQQVMARALLSGSDAEKKPGDHRDVLVTKILAALQEGIMTTGAEVSDYDLKSVNTFLTDQEVENAPTESELDERLVALQIMSKSGIEQFVKIAKASGGGSDNSCAIM